MDGNKYNTENVKIIYTKPWIIKLNNIDVCINSCERINFVINAIKKVKPIIKNWLKKIFV